MYPSLFVDIGLLLRPTSEWADEIDGVADAFLPLAGDLHAGVVVVDDQERGSRQLKVVFLLEILRGSVVGK